MGALAPFCAGSGLRPTPTKRTRSGDDQPLLAELYGASVHGRIATGRRAGQPISTVGDGADVEAHVVPSGPRCASVAGINVHANVCVAARDRESVERLCRYCARPAVATERLSPLRDGRVLYRLKHPWRGGSTHVVFEPLELVAKLAALVPPPRFNLVRYHGVLAPAAHSRPEIVPESLPPEGETSPHSGCRAHPAAAGDTPGRPRRSGPRERPTRYRTAGCGQRPRNYTWAELMHPRSHGPFNTGQRY
jgi:hypothetical protein